MNMEQPGAGKSMHAQQTTPCNYRLEITANNVQ